MKNKEIQLNIANYWQIQFILEDLSTQFPKNELKEKMEFDKLIAKKKLVPYVATYGDDIVGYVIFAQTDNKDFLWLDYFAVLKKYHSHGFGAKILEKMSKIESEKKGVFFEIEIPTSEAPHTIRRLNFYKRQNAEIMDFKYLYPTQEDFIEMKLCFLPFSSKLPDKKASFNVIKNVFSNIHANLFHLQRIIEKMEEINALKP
ncbi:MAG: GNAT family N-acetyltransferase [Candidatus Gastranaerophilales bacterium]|nr:GNAT family N-acetyltransferase [Candidatus Gastranaerophilales bacterium]